MNPSQPNRGKQNVLRGMVEFRLSFDESSNDFSHSRKRKRNSTSSTIDTLKGQLSGFFFIPDESSMSVMNPKSDQCLISVPVVSSRYLSEAVAYNLGVEISHYSVIPLTDTVESVGMIEVHPNGLNLIGNAPSCYPSGEVWRLSHFRRREIMEEAEMKVSKEFYNISGIVDAISPIISLDPTEEPFCLMELYDEEKVDVTCVVAFSGQKTLLWQSSIQPGESLRLYGLRRKSWKVTESFETKHFQHLKQRVPTYIFVCTSKTKVQWGQSIETIASSKTFVPRTPLPLTTLQGKIVRVKRKSVHTEVTTIKIIEYVDVVSDISSTDVPCRLFLAYFPMSMELQLSLRTGATIRAINIHPLGVYISSRFPTGMNSFGSCLRSTVTYLSPPSTTDEYRSVTPRSMKRFVPYRLGKVSSSYRDMIFKTQVSTWLKDHFDECSVRPISALPSPEDFLFLYPPLSTRTKNPYAEFFDHALDMDSSNIQNKDACGCFNSREDERNTTYPSMVGLNELRVAAVDILARVFRSRLSNDTGHARGWSGTIHLSAKEIIAEMSRASVSNDLVIVGGLAGVGTMNRHIQRLSDRKCQLPVRFRDPETTQNGDFVIGRVETVVVSCFCLFAPTNEAGVTENRSSCDDSGILHCKSLPPVDDTLFHDSMGGSVLLRIGNHILVASVQLWCEGGRIVSENDNSPHTQNFLAPTTLQSCTLTRSLTYSEPASFNGRIQGHVIRSRFRLARSCLVLTIGEFELRQGLVSPSHVQTLDVEVFVPVHPEHMASFKRVLQEIKSEDMGILEDECVLGASWWTVAEKSYTAPLVAGGWDEYCRDRHNRHLVVTLSLPAERLAVARRGYIRCSTPLDLVRAELAYSLGSNTNPDRKKEKDFDFITGQKFFDGMLCRRPRRRKMLCSSTRCLGELLEETTWRGNIISIAGLYEIPCRTIQSSDPSRMSPSLVRRINGAQFLGIIFCSATCVCSRCFKRLIDISPPRKTTTEGGVHQTFWHNPAPGGPKAPDLCSEVSSSHCLPHIRNSSLRCPDKCPLTHLSIQWQCSGILDDGTGQAKLYADREAALTLLSFDNQELEQIEKAMWISRCPEIRYQKSIPPRNELRKQLDIALARSSDNGSDPLELLCPSVKAEYLVHQHCRLSKRPRRALDYFVRCRPLSDGVNHLNHDVINTFVSSDGFRKKLSGQVASYKLPQIKLELVECCVPNDTAP